MMILSIGTILAILIIGILIGLLTFSLLAARNLERQQRFPRRAAKL